VGRAGLLAVVTAVAAFAVIPQTSDAQQRARVTTRSLTVAGTVTLKPVDTTKNCRFTAGAKTLIASCTQLGTFSGKPGAAGASYGWRWDLELKNGVTTGNAPEVGRLLLNFGAPGMLTLDLKGRQVPVGKPGANGARGRTTGTWKLTAGTGSFKGKTGSGTYTFSTSRTGKTTFQVARIELKSR
jgi:hypothetical protein